MKRILFHFLFIGLLLPGCFAPVNMNFDSARMLEKNKVEVQGNASGYYYNGEHRNTNFGAKIGWGISEKFNLKLRYEHLSIRNRIVNYDLRQPELFPDHNYSFIELEPKIRLGKRSALSLPVNYYYGPWPAASFDPRFFYTYTLHNKFEFTAISKMHIVYYYGSLMRAFPGINFGVGLSSNLDEWALRPEIGYDGYVSFGIGYSYYFGRKK